MIVSPMEHSVQQQVAATSLGCLGGSSTLKRKRMGCGMVPRASRNLLICSYGSAQLVLPMLAGPCAFCSCHNYRRTMNDTPRVVHPPDAGSGQADDRGISDPADADDGECGAQSGPSG